MKLSLTHVVAVSVLATSSTAFAPNQKFGKSAVVLEAKKVSFEKIREEHLLKVSIRLQMLSK